MLRLCFARIFVDASYMELLGERMHNDMLAEARWAHCHCQWLGSSTVELHVLTLGVVVGLEGSPCIWLVHESVVNHDGPDRMTRGFGPAIMSRLHHRVSPPALLG